jgi:putative membrane protein
MTMNLLSQIAAGATVGGLVFAFVMEVFFHRSPRTYSFTLIRPEDVAAVRLWVIFIGLYNLCFGAGIAVGLLLLNTGAVGAGRALVLFGCISHVFLAVLFPFVERRLWRNALMEGIPPLIAVLAFLAWG